MDLDKLLAKLATFGGALALPETGRRTEAVIDNVKVKEILSTGTTIAAINCGINGVVIGGERRAMMMGGSTARIASDDFKKLFIVDDTTVFAFAGAVGDGLAIRQYFKYFVGVWRDIFRPVSVKGRVRTLARILAQSHANIVPILAIWDGQHVLDKATKTFRPRGGRLFMLMPDGAYMKLPFATTGSGGDTIRGDIREYCEVIAPDQDRRDPRQAALLLYNLLARVGREDPHSGGEPYLLWVNCMGVFPVNVTSREPVDENREGESKTGDDGKKEGA